MSPSYRKQGLCLSVYVDDREMAGKKEHLSQVWVVLRKSDDLEDQESLIDQVRLSCTQPGPQIKNKNVTNVFKIPYHHQRGCPNRWEDREIASWSYDV